MPSTAWLPRAVHPCSIAVAVDRTIRMLRAPATTRQNTAIRVATRHEIDRGVGVAMIVGLEIATAQMNADRPRSETHSAARAGRVVPLALPVGDQRFERAADRGLVEPPRCECERAIGRRHHASCGFDAGDVDPLPPLSTRRARASRDRSGDTAGAAGRSRLRATAPGAIRDSPFPASGRASRRPCRASSGRPIARPSAGRTAPPARRAIPRSAARWPKTSVNRSFTPVIIDLTFSKSRANCSSSASALYFETVNRPLLTGLAAFCARSAVSARRAAITLETRRRRMAPVASRTRRRR